MSRTFKILISNWPRTRKFNRLLHARKAMIVTFLTVTRWSRSTPIFMFWLVKIWQVSSCGKFIQRLETCLLIAEADRVLCHLVMFKTVFFYLKYKMKYSCYQDCSVIYGWFVYCAFCWQMHRLSKSLEIRKATLTPSDIASFLNCLPPSPPLGISLPLGFEIVLEKMA